MEIPVRSQLRHDSLFGASEEERQLASDILAEMPEATSPDEIDAEDNARWDLRESRERLEKSPVGRAILSLIDGEPQEIFPKAEVEAPLIVEPPAAEPTQPLPRPPQPQPDPLHQRLAHWPPRTETPPSPASFPTEPGTIKKPPVKIEPLLGPDLRYLY